MDKYVILFTMKGCPFCEQLKEKLNEQTIEFVERDIDQYSDEYEVFSTITKSDYVPAFMLIEDYGEKQETKFFTPDKDFLTIDEGVELIKKEIL